MGLYEKWEEIAGEERDSEEYDAFWQSYFESEMKIYAGILQLKQNVIQGTVKDLATKYGMTSELFAGFLSGINTSLINELKVEELDEESEIKLEIDFEKLYYNMLAAKADWLQGLKQWEDILSVERRKEIKTEYNKTQIVVKGDKVGRNDDCPCGSGKKYKKCCGK